MVGSCRNGAKYYGGTHHGKQGKILEGLQIIVTDLAQQADSHAIQSRVFASERYAKLADDTFRGAHPAKCAVIVTPEKLIVASPNGENKKELTL